MSAESDAIKKTSKEYMNAINSGDLNQWLGTLTEDVVCLPPDQPMVSGKKAVRPWIKKTFFDPFEMKFNFSFDELEVFGSLAFARGRYTLSLTPGAGGSTTKTRGKFIDIFRRQPDGSWRFARIIWNSDKPATGGSRKRSS